MNSGFKDLLRIFGEEGGEYLIAAKEKAGRPQDLANIDERKHSEGR